MRLFTPRIVDFTDKKLAESKFKQRRIFDCVTDRDSGTATASSSVYCWGHGENGRLGTGDTYSRLEPCMVMHTQCQVKGIACGSLHTLLLLEDSLVFAWGEGQNGQLGLGSLRESLQPNLVSSLSKERVSIIAAGGLSSAAGLSNSIQISFYRVGRVEQPSTVFIRPALIASP
jgi:alpha-tubulin suppressor-like RCC1 family protein